MIGINVMLPRRTFLQSLASLPALAFLRPRRAPVAACVPTGLTYSDDSGRTDFSGFFDGAGIRYAP